MSLEHYTHYPCPECGESINICVRDTVNTRRHPEMKAAVRNLEAFKNSCPHCGFELYSIGNLLYHDFDSKILIQMCVTDEYYYRCLSSFEPKEGKEMNPFSRMFGIYTIRMVMGINEFLEKLLIFDDGRDDRVIELIKAKLLQDMDDNRKNVQSCCYAHNNEGLPAIQFNLSDDLICFHTISDELYDKTAAVVDKYYPNIRGRWLSVNAEWASDALGKLPPFEQWSKA